MSVMLPGLVLLDRMERAVLKGRERLQRATQALEGAGITYAVIGGHAVAAWVETTDPSCVRNTPNVDLLIRRCDLNRVKSAFEAAGFVYQQGAIIDSFSDGPEVRPRVATNIIYAAEKVKPEYAHAAPDLDCVVIGPAFSYLSLAALLTMKLTANRRIDSVHIRDLHGAGTIDHSWLARVPPELAPRLKAILDDPDG